MRCSYLRYLHLGLGHASVWRIREAYVPYPLNYTYIHPLRYSFVGRLSTSRFPTATIFDDYLSHYCFPKSRISGFQTGAER